jgi:hypothetical protein
MLLHFKIKLSSEFKRHNCCWYSRCCSIAKLSVWIHYFLKCGTFFLPQEVMECYFQINNLFNWSFGTQSYAFISVCALDLWSLKLEFLFVVSYANSSSNLWFAGCRIQDSLLKVCLPFSFSPRSFVIIELFLLLVLLGISLVYIIMLPGVYLFRWQKG